MNSKPVTIDDYRLERKFLIPDSSYEKVTHEVLVHPAVFSEIHQERKVNNIYFDTPGLENFYDNVEGRSERLKVRLRWYGALSQTSIERPVLEFKIKKGALGRKELYPIKPFAMANGKWMEGVYEALKASDLPARVLNIVAPMRPILVNTYRRRYFMSFDGKCRATVDTDMQYFRPDPVHEELLGRWKDHHNIVLELKYAFVEDNESTRSVANAFPFRVTKNSKYVNGVEALYNV